MLYKKVFLLALAAPCFGVLEPATRSSRLASSSQAFFDDMALPCSDSSTGLEDLETSVFYQQDNLHIHEAVKRGNGNWLQGSLPIIEARNNTPIATVRWFDSKDDIKVLFFANRTDQGLTEMRSINGVWSQTPRNLNVIVHMNPNNPGSISAVVKNGVIQVFYRADRWTVRVCKYTFSASAPVISCEANSPQWTDALDGTATTGFIDQDGGTHFFYQTNSSPWNVTEVAQASGSSTWNRQPAWSSFLQGANFAGLVGRMPQNSIWPETNRHMLIQDNSAIGWRMWTPLCYFTWWCEPRPTPGLTGNSLAAIAVSGCRSSMRTYYVTSSAAVVEMSSVQSGWNITSNNILA